MQAMPSVTLALVVHQPDERLAASTATHLPELVSHYARATAYCSRETHPTILALLRDHGVSVRVDNRQPAGISRIGQVRRETLQAALEAKTSHLQMCDFDRALHWVACYPEELGEVIAVIPAYDLLVLGRTERAWATYPPYQAETEPLFNRVFALVTGCSWDVGAGSRGLSRRAAETLLTLSQENTVGVDAEWPLLLMQRQEFRMGHRCCEGLEFETADRFAAEIEAAGGYKAWEAQMSSDPARWLFRLEVALRIAETAVRLGGVNGRQSQHAQG